MSAPFKRGINSNKNDMQGETSNLASLNDSSESITSAEVACLTHANSEEVARRNTDKDPNHQNSESSEGISISLTPMTESEDNPDEENLDSMLDSVVKRNFSSLVNEETTPATATIEPTPIQQTQDLNQNNPNNSRTKSVKKDRDPLSSDSSIESEEASLTQANSEEVARRNTDKDPNQQNLESSVGISIPLTPMTESEDANAGNKNIQNPNEENLDSMLDSVVKRNFSSLVNEETTPATATIAPTPIQQTQDLNQNNTYDNESTTKSVKKIQDPLSSNSSVKSETASLTQDQSKELAQKNILANQQKSKVEVIEPTSVESASVSLNLKKIRIKKQVDDNAGSIPNSLVNTNLSDLVNEKKTASTTPISLQQRPPLLASSSKLASKYPCLNTINPCKSYIEISKKLHEIRKSQKLEKGNNLVKNETSSASRPVETANRDHQIASHNTERQSNNSNLNVYCRVPGKTTWMQKHTMAVFKRIDSNSKREDEIKEKPPTKLYNKSQDFRNRTLFDINYSELRENAINDYLRGVDNLPSPSSTSATQFSHQNAPSNSQSSSSNNQTKNASSYVASRIYRKIQRFHWNKTN
jgi:hypothetical protein